ncbi:MAG: aldo/keto reductase [Mycetocola sp.]
MNANPRHIPMRRHPLDGSGFEVSVVSVGTSPLGGMPETYGYDVAEEQAIATVAQFTRSSMNLIDTSNEYGAGESERRIGIALAESTLKLGDLIVATKADPEPGATSFDAARVRSSFTESITRLGLTSVPIYHLHDPERFSFESMIAPGGAIDGMRQLKEEGLVELIGVAGGDLEQMYRYVDTGEFDILLNHSQYNLIDRTADDLITHARAAGLHYFNAAPYASGMFAKSPSEHPRYQYRTPPDDVVATTRWLHAECARYDLPLAALALQFSTRDPRVTTTIVGVSSPARIDALEANEALEIPDALWESVCDRLGIRREWR